MQAEHGFELLKRFFAKPVCQRATKPLQKGVEIAVWVGKDHCLTLRKTPQQMEVLSQAPLHPDLTFHIPLTSLESLAGSQTDDIGEIGVLILQGMAHSDPARRIQAKVHIGPLDLLLKGYIRVLPLGGTRVMKFFASKGFTGISKIKEGIAKLRE